MDQYIDDFLKDRLDKGSLRSLKRISSRSASLITIDGKEYIDFSSNDYLGLAKDPSMAAAAKEGAERYGSGASASRLLSGNHQLFSELEDKTAVFKGKEASLVFNSGYQANVGIISAMCKDDCIVFADKLSHASMIDGIKLSGAKCFRYKHNDMRHLEELLIKYRKRAKRAIIITESVFSMDGDKAPLKELANLKNKYNAYFMVDEAHATGIFGDTGSGLVEECGITSEVELIMGTFSKALGSFGGYVACSNKIKEYLINSSRSFIYSTALPPSVVSANIKAIEIVNNEPYRRAKLLKLSEHFRKALKEHGLKINSSSQIVPVIIGNEQKAVDTSDRFKQNGIWVMPIRYPTVPLAQARLRFSLSYNNTEEEIQKVNEQIQIYI